MVTRSNTKQALSWGQYPPAEQTLVAPPMSRENPPDLGVYEGSILPYGYGRSYGDSCLNDGGILLETKSLNRFIAFDEENGVICCEAGVTLAEVQEIIIPRGWFIPVSPGTKFVSIGGAIANDVHGKNHHRRGTFGCHVTRFELLRSNGQRFICSPTENVELFQATIGGLGLTGLILWAEFKLKKINNPYIEMEQIKYGSLKEFFELSASSDKDYEYTVTWVDFSATGEKLGRGHFIRGNFSQSKYLPIPRIKTKPLIAVPFNMPEILINPLSIKAFNILYYNRQLPKKKRATIHYNPFFYPLDAIASWNRFYGKRGFLQYQYVIPFDTAYDATHEIMERIIRSGQGTPLNVLKMFGTIKSPGMLSFPRPGITLALDFAYNGPKTLELLNTFDEVVRQSGGILYPAKDARMSAADFQTFYPNWREFAQYVDPKFSSSFWRRVTAPIGVSSPKSLVPSQ